MFKLGSKNLLSLASDDPDDPAYIEPEKRRIYENYEYPSYEYILNPDGTRRMDANKQYMISLRKNMIHRAGIITKCNVDTSYRNLILDICKYNILFYVNTFCYTYRLDLPIGQDPYVNVCTFPFQDDILTWMVWCFKHKDDGLVEKSRNVGATWMWVWFMDWLKFYHGITTGTMSQKEDDVDNRTANSIMEKLRINLRAQPEWSRFGWVENSNHDKLNMIQCPESNLTHLGGVAKGTAFRGGRLSVTFNDEFAHVLEAAQVLDSLSAISTCNFFVSTPKGEHNEYARMALTPGVNKKSVHWSDHPLRNKEWEKKIRSKPSITEETFAQEYEISYTKSNVGRIFPMFAGRASDSEDEWSHVADPEDLYYDFNPNYPVHTFSDLGGDGTYFGFCQFLPSKDSWKRKSSKVMVVIDEYLVTGSEATAYKVRRDLNEIADEKGYLFESHITDMRTLDQTPQGGSKGDTWMAKMSESRQSLMERFNADYGEPIYFEKTIRCFPTQIIDNMHNVLYSEGKFIINPRCKILISALNNWTYQIDRHQKDANGRPLIKTNNKGQAIPEHSPASHPGTAVLYGANYFFGKEKQKKDSYMKKKRISWGFGVKRIQGV